MSDNNGDKMEVEKQDPLEEIAQTIERMQQALARQDTPLLKSIMKGLQEKSQSQLVVDYLVPRLFQAENTIAQGNSNSSNNNNNSNSVLSAQDALSLVGCLVSVDAATYLKPISRAVKYTTLLSASSSEKPLVVSPELVSVLVEQLKGTDVEVSSNATEALVACCRKLGPTVADPALQAIVAAWQQAWDQLLTRTGDKNNRQSKNQASTICVRCASAVVDLIILGDHIMQSSTTTPPPQQQLEGTTSCSSKCAMDLFLQMLGYENDPLLQMAVLDLLERMASVQPMHGNRARWLCSKPVLTPLLQLAGAGNDDDNDTHTTINDPDPIIGGPALRVLSAVCRLGQQDSNLFAGDSGGGKEALLGFHKALHNFQQGSAGGELDRLALVDAISSFASASPDALELVLSDPVTRDAWLSLSSVAQPKLKAAILTSVAMVIDPAPSLSRDAANGDATTTAIANVPTNAMAMKLFALLGQVNNFSSSTEVILSLAKSPIPETRLGAYNLMRAVAKTNTGSQILLSHPGFFEFLISREGESTKEGREGKYVIVEAVMNSPVKGLLANDIVQKLERILKEGPHFVPPIRPDLMTE